MSNYLFAKITINNLTKLTLNLQSKSLWGRNTSNGQDVESYWDSEPPAIIKPFGSGDPFEESPNIVVVQQRSADVWTDEQPDWELGGSLIYSSDSKNSRDMLKLEWNFPSSKEDFFTASCLPGSGGTLTVRGAERNTIFANPWDRNHPEVTIIINGV